MKYLESQPFSVALGGDEYGKGWDAVFGKKKAKAKVDRSVIYKAIEDERVTHPENNDPEELAPADWERLIKSQLVGAMGSVLNPEAYRRQMLRVAAVAVEAIESHDRKAGPK